jgi:hypothetical protein
MKIIETHSCRDPAAQSLEQGSLVRSRKLLSGTVTGWKFLEIAERGNVRVIGKVNVPIGQIGVFIVSVGKWYKLHIDDKLLWLHANNVLPEHLWDVPQDDPGMTQDATNGNILQVNLLTPVNILVQQDDT